VFIPIDQKYVYSFCSQSALPFCQPYSWWFWIKKAIIRKWRSWWVIFRNGQECWTFGVYDDRIELKYICCDFRPKIMWKHDCCSLYSVKPDIVQIDSEVLWHCWLAGWASRRAPGLPVKEWWGAGVVISLEQGADCLHMVQLMPLHPKTPSSRHIWIQTGFSFLVPAYPGCTGKEAVKRV